MDQKITLTIRKVTVLHNVAVTDRVYLQIDAPSMFPEMGHQASVTLDLRQGYAEEWLKSMGIEIDEVIDG